MWQNVLHRIYLQTLKGSWQSQQRAFANPRDTQLQRLQKTLALVAGSTLDRETGWSQIQSYSEFVRKVPIASYEDWHEWIELMTKDASVRLTSEPVLAFEKTGGSTQQNKFIPFTPAFLAEINRVTNAWIYDVYRQYPKLIGTRSYWSISPLMKDKALTDGGTPIGLASDEEYFGTLAKFFLKYFIAVPNSVGQIKDMNEWRHATCRYLLSCEDLGLISVWSPTFLILLMDEIKSDFTSLVSSLSNRRQLQILQRLDRVGTLCGEALWPRLGLISCWADGISAEFIPQLRAYFPQTPIQGKGLMATEGVISAPMAGAAHDTAAASGTRMALSAVGGGFSSGISSGISFGAVVSVHGHFLEFIDVDHVGKAQPRVLLADQLLKGGVYSPVITSANGMLRYHLKDLIRCVGSESKIPRVQFLQKMDRTCDLAGEKLTLGRVQEAISQVLANHPLPSEFLMLAPLGAQSDAVTNKLGYVLFVESVADKYLWDHFADALERELRRSHHYNYCRDLGQLQAIEVRMVKRALTIYQETLVAQGMRLGDIKPTSFDHRRIWCEAFAGADRRSEQRQRSGEVVHNFQFSHKSIL